MRFIKRGAMMETLYISNDRDIETYFSSAQKSNESYFGLNNPFKTELITRVAEMRRVFQSQIKNVDGTLFDDDIKATSKTKRIAAEAISSELLGIERLIATTLNVENCRIALVEGPNCRGEPMCLDERALSSDKDSDSFIQSLSNITETKTGIRFKTKNKKYIYIIFGSQYLTRQYTDAETAALIVRCIGDAVQQFVFDANKLVMFYTLKRSITNIHSNFKIFNSITKMALGPFIKSKWIIQYSQKLKFLKSQIKIPIYLTDLIFTAFSFIVTNNDASLSKKLLDGTLTKEESANIIERAKPLLKTHEFYDFTMNEELHVSFIEDFFQSRPFSKFASTLLKVLFYITSTLSTLSRILTLDWVYLIWPNIISTVHYLQHKKTLKLSQKLNSFSDSFVAFYGLSTDLATAVSKTIDSDKMRNSEFGRFNFLNYVPIVNIAINTNHVINSFISIAVTGDKLPQNRISELHAQLRYELKNNKDITEQDKKDIQHQLDELEDVYKTYVNGNGIENMTFKFVNAICKNKLEKRSEEETVNDIMSSYNETVSRSVV